MYKKRIYVVMFLALIISFSSYGKEYICPKLPVVAKIGQEIGDGWKLGYENEREIGFFRKYYYKFFGEEYQLNRWFSLSGINEVTNKTSRIACCDSLKNGVLMMCAYKIVHAKKCESKFFREKKKRFICDEK